MGEKYIYVYFGACWTTLNAEKNSEARVEMQGKEDGVLCRGGKCFFLSKFFS